MAVLLVTYDLNKEVVRPKIVKFIDDNYAWARLSESSYAIETNETPAQTYQRFLPMLDDNDALCVIKLSKPWYGQSTQDVIDWLENRLTW